MASRSSGYPSFGMASRTSGYPSCHNSLRGKVSEVPIAPANLHSTPACTDGNSHLREFKVVIGTSQMAEEDRTFVSSIANFSDKSEREVRQRLAYGDVGSERANRVMHVALINGVPVGWCSSSTQSWGGDGHWGALSVDPSAQGKGVASELVAAAEKRLLDAGCQSVQIEYRFTVGDPSKERLYAWYEGKLGFEGGPRRSGFRVCHKMLSAESFQEQHFKNFSQRQSLTLPESDASTASTGQWEQQKAKRTKASSPSSSSPSASSSEEDNLVSL